MTEAVMINDGQDIPYADVMLAKRCADVLGKHYPGYDWLVSAEHEQGVIVIKSLKMPPQWGYVIKIGEIYSDSYLTRMVVTGGGEMLERFKMRRGKIDFDQFDALPTDARGSVIGDLS